MAQITLNYWSKNTDAFATQRACTMIERVYVNDAQRNSLGYWERSTAVEARGFGSSYDVHRQAKGDTVVAAAPVVRFVSETLNEAALLAAIGVGDAEVAQANSDNGGGLFVAVSRKARNGHPSWYGNTPKAQIKKTQKARDAAVFVL